MSRIPKWKIEKTKVKVVFRLQFHATHIPQSGWDKLFVSSIPADTGKATAKTTKANVRSGNCKWSDPIYETTRLLQDTRTKKYDEKLYKLVVAMGSSRSSLLGEVNINLADFADSSKPFSVGLPLQSCDFGSILHVTVQLLTSKTGFREFEQQRELSVKGFQMISGQISHDPAETVAASSEMATELIDKVNARVRFNVDSIELPSLEEVGESNDDYEDSAAGIDGSSYTSESLNAEKNDISSTHEVDSLKSTSADISGLPIGQSPKTVRGNQCGIQLSTQGSNDWTHGWGSDYSVDNDLATAYEENNRLRVRLEVAESAFLQLKSEAKSLQRITDELGAETQSLAEQLSLELASGEKLTREVSILKSECSKFKNDLEELKSATAMQYIPGRRSLFPVMMKGHLEDALFEGKFDGSVLSTDQEYLSHDIQMKWLQGLLLIEGKVREIYNKACLGYLGSGFDLHSDFEVLECVLQNLKDCITQKTSLELVEGTQLNEIHLTRVLQSEHFIEGQELERTYTDHHNPEGMLHCISNSHPIFHEQEPLKKNFDAVIMEEKMVEVVQIIEESKTEKENLRKKMDQMECYYEVLIQELEESQKQTLNELENLRADHASCLCTISDLQNQIEKLHQDTSQQFIRFAEERHGLDSFNKELEKRAIASETALKRVRWYYAIAVDCLQKDLELLSFQVLSMYETTENLAKQALTDASELYSQQYPEEHSEEQYKASVLRIQSEIVSMKTAHGTSSTLNGASDKVSCKIVHDFDFVEDNKHVFHRGLPMNIELQTRGERDPHVNGLKFVNIEQTATELNNIQEKENLVLNTDLSSEAQRNDNLWERSAIFKSKSDSQGSETVKPLLSQNQYGEPDNQVLDDKIGLEEMRNSLHMLDELHSNTEVELSEMQMLNMHWEVFSEVIQETLRDVNDRTRHMKEKMSELAQQLQHSTETNELLMFKLHSTLDGARILKEDEAKCLSKCDDLMFKNHMLEEKIRDVSDGNASLTQKVVEYERLIAECGVYENKYKNCLDERNAFEDLLKHESLQSSSLQSEISSITEDFKTLKEEFDMQSLVNSDLQKTVSYLQEKLGDLCYSMVSCNEKINGSTVDGIALQQELESKNYIDVILHLEQFQQEAYKKTLQLCQEKKEIEEERDIAQCSLNKTESQILHMKQKSESDLGELTTKLDLSNTLVEKLQQELQDVAEKLKFSSEAEEKHRLINRELSSKLTILEIELQQATDEYRDLAKKVLVFENVNEELERTKSSLMDCMQENRALMMSIQSGKVASIQMENDLSDFKESMRRANDELQFERAFRDELEASVTDLTLQLKEKGQQLLSCDEQKAELVVLRKRVFDLETELEALATDLTLQLKEKGQQLLSCDEQKAELVLLRKKIFDLQMEMQRFQLHGEESQRKVDGETLALRFQVADLENHLAAILEYSLTAGVKVTYLRSQFQSRIQELVDQNKALEMGLEELHSEHLDVVASLEVHMASEARAVDENARLLTALQTLKSKIEIIVCEKEGLVEQINENSAMWAEVEDMKARAETVEADVSQEKLKYEDDICHLRNNLVSLEKEVDNLWSSRDELETTEIILRSKLDVQRTHISLLEECDQELKKLREQHNELNHKLSEQILKTEEFKNLSIHLRELKDKADAECSQARERKETEGTSLAMQESLRIAFIKEKCESKLQEMRNQLYVSQKYAEEMLLKLQNALDEVESGKKSEASLVKRNDELSIKISDLESELQTVVTDRRELVKAYDRMKAELECTILNLDCCKEEKLNLESSLLECNEERTRVRVELDLVKRLLENMASMADIGAHHEPGNPNTTSIGELLEDGQSGFLVVHQETPSGRGTCSEKDIVTAAGVDPVKNVNMGKLLDTSGMLSSCKVQDVLPACTNGSSHPSLQPNLLASQDDLVIRSTTEQETLMENNTKDIADINDHFKEQRRLITSMDLLHKELERLKNENLSSLLPLEDNHFDAALQGLQRELSQLDMANEHLGSIFPSFKELPGNGNALERVLALELELAEALQTKKKSNVQFQSSFLKQHHDEAAVFQSFRDINELIKDMLELKRRHAAVETELKEMQGRYSQLSLQFAEVEGERQQLVMTLKNRTPKKSWSHIP